MPYARINKPYSEINKAYAQNNKPYARINKTPAEINKPYARINNASTENYKPSLRQDIVHIKTQKKHPETRDAYINYFIIKKIKNTSAPAIL